MTVDEIGKMSLFFYVYVFLWGKKNHSSELLVLIFILLMVSNEISSEIGDAVKHKLIQTFLSYAGNCVNERSICQTD